MKGNVKRKIIADNEASTKRKSRIVSADLESFINNPK
jgi:hypothetical protein